MSNNKFGVCLNQDLVDINIYTQDKSVLADLYEYFESYANFVPAVEKPTFEIEILEDDKNLVQPSGKMFETTETKNSPNTKVYIDNQARKVTLVLHPECKNKGLEVRRNIYNIYARIMEEFGYYTLHCSCVEKNGKTFVVIGRKNAGKTVTMINLLKNGFTLISNDRVSIREKNGKLFAIGYPLSIGIRVTHEWFNNPDNKVIADYINKKGFNFNFDLGDSDKNKFYFTPKGLAELLNTKVFGTSTIDGVIIPSFNKNLDKLNISTPSQNELLELVEESNIPALHETKIWMEYLELGKDLNPIKTAVAKKIASLPAFQIEQSAKTLNEFYEFTNGVTKKTCSKNEQANEQSF